MAKIPGLIIRVLSLLFFIPLISCLSGNDTSLERRQYQYTNEIWTITFYGAPDSYKPSVNCEAGVKANVGSNTIAHPGCYWNGGHRGKYAGGSGSYGNPLTAASDFYSNNSPVPQCGVWYSPFLQKWLIYEDYCPSCTGKPGKAHFDVWVGGNGGPAGQSYNKPGLCQCENSLTPGDSEACAYFNVAGATSQLEVNTANLWDGSNCNMGIPQWRWSGNNGNLKNIC
ncbi:hypothetical protein H2200_000528 [Cladophialophora chaetospira]|uniref:Uncharacterized protein n=1 Tax=Cladophialophora chaetospira TaxID=386627 RepID=A0AA39CP96_9EURO|nr:hypothetical protein H2200_000528 [Cladophialophora chaetospira]